MKVAGDVLEQSPSSSEYPPVPEGMVRVVVPPLLIVCPLPTKRYWQQVEGLMLRCPPPEIAVMPLPASAPPVHVMLVTVTVPGPSSVPFMKFSPETLTEPLATTSPPLMEELPVKLAPEPSWNVPPSRETVPGEV